MPVPVSRTANFSLTLSPASSIATDTITSPRSVNLMALLTRLIRIWPRRSGSPPVGRDSGCAAIRISRSLSWAF